MSTSSEKPKISVGDLVQKAGHSHRGERGIVCNIFVNPSGYEFATVISFDGNSRHWYLPNVERIYDNVD